MSVVNFQNYNSPEWNADWENFLLAKALEKNLTPAQTRVFLTRFKQDNGWTSKIDDIWQQSDVNSFEAFVKHLTKIYRAYRDECPTLGQGAGNFPILREYLLDEFSQVSLPINSINSFNDIRYQIILEPGALIRIKAPSKMGKTQLLNNILSFSNKQQYQTVRIDFLQIESSKFNNLDLFLRWFCMAISDALQLEIDLEQYWVENRGCMQSCRWFLKDVLRTSEQPLVLGLDDVDRLLKYPNISQDFFYLLRTWHEESKNKELWEQLRLIVVYSTEDFGTLNINRSPFNVGNSIDIKPFNRKQIEELSQGYQLDLSDLEINHLINLLGGHPYLTDLIMSYLIRNPEISLATLLEKAPTDIGIYSSFLQNYLSILKYNVHLNQAFLEVINSQISVQIDTLLAKQLVCMGLTKWGKSGNAIVPFCELYRLYFKERLVLSEETETIN